MKIPFKQFLLPDGKMRTTSVECPEGYEAKVQELIDAEVSFECEILQTEQVSFTVEFTTPDDEIQTLAHEISSNDEKVFESIKKLIDRAHQEYKEIELSELGNPI